MQKLKMSQKEIRDRGYQKLKAAGFHHRAFAVQEDVLARLRRKARVIGVPLSKVLNHIEV